MAGRTGLGQVASRHFANWGFVMSLLFSWGGLAKSARLVFYLAVGLAVVGTPLSRVAGQTSSWIDPNGGDYSDTANWLGSVPDTIGENARFNIAPTFDVLFGSGSNTTVGDLIVNDGDVTFASDGATVATYTIDDDAFIEGGDLTLSQTGGVGDKILDVGDLLQIRFGSTLRAELGSTVTADRMFVGNSSAGGTAIFDGAGTMLTINSGIVGLGGTGGTGTLTFQNGSTGNSISGLLSVMNESSFIGTTGRLNVLSAATLQTEDIEVGFSGSASAVQEGTLTVSGAGSMLTQTGASTLTIGDDVNPNVTSDVIVSSGGQFDSGTGATLIQNSGTLTITDGTFNANGALTMTAGTTLSLDGGALNANAGLDNSAGGTLNFLDGLLSVTGGSFVPNTGGPYTIQGPTAAEQPHLQIGAGATLNFGNGLFVGLARHGELTVTGGGSVSSATGVIGDTDGSTGTATVDSAGSTWTNTGTLFVGDGGDGTLNIQNGGAVSNTEGFIGNLSTSTSTATVDGAGSTWTNSVNLFVGNSGTGTLNIQNGGTVSNSDGFIGDDPNSTGMVTVDGSDPNGNASTWTNSSDLFVGFDGNGTLTIQNGGTVSDRIGYIGRNASSTGTATVDGAGSTWINSTNMVVGHSGNGTLNIQNGGSVSNQASGNIGNGTGSTGMATVGGRAPPGRIQVPC